jgi:hypothetical protein
MNRLYIPAAVAIVAIVGLTAWAAHFSDRFTSSSMTAAEFGARFKNVPTEIGDWVGQDQPIDPSTLEQAGAVSHVSRRYINQRNPGQSVDLWLIVGHAREICRHTPDICYPSQGYSQIGNRITFPIVAPEDPDHPAEFFTAKFRNEGTLGTKTERVFWAWNGNQPEKNEWEAPDYQKQYYGNNTALYKMYFTAQMSSDDEETNKNLAVDFAKLILPDINRALFPERYPAAASAIDASVPAPAAPAEAPAAG